MKQLQTQTVASKGTFSLKNLKPDLLKVRLQHIALFAEIATKYGGSIEDHRAGMYVSFSISKALVEEVTTKYKDKTGLNFTKKNDAYTKGSSLHVIISTADNWEFVRVYAQSSPFLNIE